MESRMGRTRSLLLLTATLAVSSRLSWRMGWQCARTAAANKRSGGIIRHASDAIISTDEHQHILQANPSAAAMFGTTVQAMEGAPLHRYIPRDQRQSIDTASAHYFGATGIRLSMKGRRATDY